MTKLKIGILGSGSHAVTNIIPILINSPEFDAVAIQTRTPDRAEELQKKFNIRCVTGRRPASYEFWDRCSVY